MAEETLDSPADKPVGAPGAGAGADSDLALRIAGLEADVADARDRVLRAAAEMENLRRRNEREMADARQYAVSTFARDLLPVVDNLRRALDSAGHRAEAKAIDAKATTLVEGVEMTERELLRVLEKNGVRKIEPVGQKFDPHRHQAMFEVETADHPPGTVAEMAQPGYAIGERVLRPALVAIARAPRPAPPAAPTNAAPSPDVEADTQA